MTFMLYLPRVAVNGHRDRTGIQPSTIDRGEKKEHCLGLKFLEFLELVLMSDRYLVVLRLYRYLMTYLMDLLDD